MKYFERDRDFVYIGHERNVFGDRIAVALRVLSGEDADGEIYCLCEAMKQL